MSHVFRLVGAETMRALDHHTIETLGVPGELLMESAGRAVAEAVLAVGGPGDRVLLVCGAGNNGGDGLAAARHLGFARCALHLLAEPDPEKAPDAALQARVLRAAGARLVVGALPDPAQHRGAVWIDAMFGTGLDRALREPARGWVEAYNRADGPRLSVDVPSGLHGDTGETLGVACRADVTVTFVAKKRGMVTANGRALCGRVVVAGLGLP